MDILEIDLPAMHFIDTTLTTDAEAMVVTRQILDQSRKVCVDAQAVPEDTQRVALPQANISAN